MLRLDSLNRKRVPFFKLQIKLHEIIMKKKYTSIINIEKNVTFSLEVIELMIHS